MAGNYPPGVGGGELGVEGATEWEARPPAGATCDACGVRPRRGTRHHPIRVEYQAHRDVGCLWRCPACGAWNEWEEEQ